MTPALIPIKAEELDQRLMRRRAVLVDIREPDEFARRHVRGALSRPLSAFEAAHPDIDIIIEQFPGSSLKDFEIKLRLRYASGQAPDLFHVNENVAAELAGLDLLAPAPPQIVEMAKANSLNELVEEGASVRIGRALENGDDAHHVWMTFERPYGAPHERDLVRCLAGDHRWLRRLRSCAPRRWQRATRTRPRCRRCRRRARASRDAGRSG